MHASQPAVPFLTAALQGIRYHCGQLGEVLSMSRTGCLRGDVRRHAREQRGQGWCCIDEPRYDGRLRICRGRHEPERQAGRSRQRW